MIAAYVKNSSPAERKAMLDLIGRCTPKSTDAASVCWLAPDAHQMTLQCDAGQMHSMFMPLPHGSFDHVFVSTQLRLFSSAWSEALLAEIATLLRPNGVLWLPYFSDREAAQKRYWSLSWLTNRLGPLWKTVKGECVAAFRSPRYACDSSSVLQWYQQCSHHQVVNEYLDIQTNGLPERLDETCRAFVDQMPEAPGVEMEVPRSENGTANPKDLQQLYSYMNYSLYGAGYKTSVVSRILDDHFAHRPPLRIIDMGGGFGLVAAELLLTHHHIKTALVCDPEVSNLALARSLFDFYEGPLAGRFRMTFQPAERFLFDSPVEVVSYIGSLLYVPREQIRAVLDSAWTALNRGGLMIIHENIKSPAYRKDYDIMFTVDELEGYLQPYGPIENYLSTTAMPVRHEQVGQKTLFRVMKKR